MTGRNLSATHTAPLKRYALILAALALAASMLLANTPPARAAGEWSTPVSISPGNFTAENYFPKIAVDSDGYSHVVWTGWNSLGIVYYSNNVSGAWSYPLPLSAGCLGSHDPQIALDPDDGVHVVWAGYDNSMVRQVFYATYAGGSWSAPGVISTNTTENDEPQLALGPDGRPHALWRGDDGTNDRVFYSTDQGSGWSVPVDISPGDWGTYDPRLAVDSGGYAHATWHGHASGTSSYYYADNSGGSWSTPDLLLANAPFDPVSITTDSSNAAHVAYRDYSNVFYRTGTAGAWSAPVTAASGSNVGQPQIALYDDTDAHVVWCGYSGSEYETCYATNAGGSWSAPTVLSTTSSSNDDPQIALGPGGTAHVVWRGHDGSYDQAYYATNDGGAWSAPLALSAPGYYSYGPRVALDPGGNPHAAWWGYDETGSESIFYAEGTETGWTGPVIVSDTAAPEGSIENEYPCLAVGPGNQPHAVWRGYDGEHGQVYYATDPGSGWTDPLVLSDLPGLDSSYPQVAVGPDGTVHAVWTSYSDEAEDIFYSMNDGSGWADPIPLSTTSHGNYEPRLALGPDGAPHVAFHGHIDGCEIFYTTNPGGGWTDPVMVSSDDGNDEHSLAVDAFGQPHLAWVRYDYNYQEDDLFYSTNPDYATDPGGPWEEPTFIDNDEDDIYGVDLKTGPDGVPHLVWYGPDDYGYCRVFYATDPGGGWTEPVAISSNPEDDSFYCRLAVGPDGNPQAVWYAAGYVEAEEEEVLNLYYSTDTGAGWYDDPVLLFTSSGWSMLMDLSYPQIAVDADGAPHAAWNGAGGAGLDTWYATDPGDGWSDPLLLSTNSEINWVTSLALGPDGSPHAAWSGFDTDGVERVWYANCAPSLPAAWYLAEGATDGGFETWVLVANPGEEDVVVDITLMTENGPLSPAALQGVTVAAGTRATFNPGPYATTYHLAAKVEATGGIVCERAMYGNSRAWGTDSIGTPTPSDTWYLAEGSTDGGMETYLLMQNPNPYPVRADITFMTSSGVVEGPRGYIIKAQSRADLILGEFVTDYDVSTLVTAEAPIVCERSTYGAERTWATASIGATGTSPAWFLAEGCTAGGFETWVLVQNPSAAPVTIDLTLMTENGPQSPADLQDVVLPARSRRSFNLGDYVQTFDVSTLVTADAGVVAERAVYGAGRTFATGSVGAVMPADRWFLAEGCTAGGFETWVLVQNPNATPTTVDLTFMTSSGPVAGPQGVTVPALSRISFNLGDYVIDYNVSTLITAEGGVVVERAMYGAGRTWAHDSTGFAR